MSTGAEPGHKLKAEHNLLSKVKEDIAEGERRYVQRHSRKDQGCVAEGTSKNGHSQETTAKEAIHPKWLLGNQGW